MADKDKDLSEGLPNANEQKPQPTPKKSKKALKRERQAERQKLEAIWAKTNLEPVPLDFCPDPAAETAFRSPEGDEELTESPLVPGSLVGNLTSSAPPPPPPPGGSRTITVDDDDDLRLRLKAAEAEAARYELSDFGSLKNSSRRRDDPPPPPDASLGLAGPSSSNMNE